LEKLQELETENIDSNVPKRKVKIVDCMANDVKKYKIQRRVAAADDKFDE
jgi:hypothetical protein